METVVKHGSWWRMVKKMDGYFVEAMPDGSSVPALTRPCVGPFRTTKQAQTTGLRILGRRIAYGD